jgi:hypothetical protein
MANYSVTLTNEDFRKLTEALTVISSFLTDVDIKKGKVKQYNLAKNLILDLDMSSIFNEDLCASNIKAKIPIFEIMANDGKDVTIRCEEKTETRNGMSATRRYWFLDNEISLFRFVWTDPNKLSTRYFNDTEWNNVSSKIKPELEITTLTMEDKPELVRKIKKVCDTFNSGNIVFRNDTTGFSLQTESNDKIANAKLYTEYVDLHLDKTYMISCGVDFITDGIVKSVTYFKTKDNETASFMVADCILNDKVTFKTYSQSKVSSVALQPGKAAPKKKVMQTPSVVDAIEAQQEELDIPKQQKPTIPVTLQVTNIKKHEPVIEMEESPQPPQFDQTPVTVPPKLQTQFTGYPPMNNPVTQAPSQGFNPMVDSVDSL